MKHLTEQDLNNLIDEHLTLCKGYANVCALLQTDEGKSRVRNRVKEIITEDGITSIEAALAQIESQLEFS